MSKYGVVSTISAPRLESPTQPKMIKFEVEYAAYKEYIADLNQSRATAEHIQPATIRQCVKPEMLHSLCILGEIDGASTVEDATDEVVKNWFENALKEAPKDLAQRVQTSFDAVKYRTCARDPGGAVRAFVENIVMHLDRNNASDVVKDQEICKTIVPKLINRVEPAELRIRLLNEKLYWTAAQKTSIFQFMKRASVLAVEVHNGEAARAQIKRRHERDGEKVSKKSEPEDMERGRKRSKRDSSNSRPQKTAIDGTMWTRPCLNKKCGKKHRIRDCSITSAEERKQLLDDFFAEKRGKRSIKVARLSSHSSSNGRYNISLDERVAAVAIGVSGADCSAISRDLMKQVNTGGNLEVIDLPETIELETAVESTEEAPIVFTSKQKVAMSLVLTLPRTKIPMLLHGVEFFITDQSMKEVILGRPLLNAIGFNLNDHLEKVGPAIHGMRISRVGVPTGKGSYRGVSYKDTEDDPIEPPEHLTAGFGIDDPTEIDKALISLQEEARKNGMSNEGLRELRRILCDYRSILRIKLGPDPPAKVCPLEIELRPGAKPIRCPQRRYAQNQRVFISHTIKQLEKIGAVYRNPAAKWASPALAVPKPGTDKLRFTVDLRSVNSKTIPMQSAMPHLDSKLQECGGSKVLANIDFCHGYWQFALSPDSQELMSIQTPLCMYSPRRMLQGGTDSGNRFQACTQTAFAEEVPNLIQWIDDFLLHAKDEGELLVAMEKFLAVCHRFGFRLNPKKSHFFQRTVKLCGRIISEDGVQYDPRSFKVLIDMKAPNNASELQQLLCATNWMRTSIPDYAKKVEPLHDLMEEMYKEAGSRKKSAERKFSVVEKWNPTHQVTLDDIKRHLISATKLSNPKEGHTLCLFTDASETHWAAILTQIPEEHRKLDLGDQNHGPLAFLSGEFRGAAEHWSTPEKEGFAIVEAMSKLDYLVSGRTVSIFTDHANLVNMYDPYGRNPGTPRHTASKLMRWAIKLNGFRYIIQHLPGERNVWADMMTRWAVKSPEKVKVATMRACKTVLMAPISPELKPELDWPNLKDLENSQRSSPDKPPSSFKENQGIWRKSSGRIWVPKSDTLCKLRVLIAAHTGYTGHREKEVTKANIERHFWWDCMDKNVKDFVASCIHCIASHLGLIVPRPLGSSIHATKPNEVIHFDYCYIGKGEKHHIYVLVIKDDFSGYLWLVPTTETTAGVTAELLTKWFAAFGTSRTWVSDQASHFKNTVTRSLKDHLHTQHHFTLAYARQEANRHGVADVGLLTNQKARFRSPYLANQLV